MLSMSAPQRSLMLLLVASVFAIVVGFSPNTRCTVSCRSSISLPHDRTENQSLLRATTIAGKQQEQQRQFSFVRDEMRPYAMKLHTKDQAPKEGQQPASSRPVPTWQPVRQDYLNFLTDSLAVYEMFDDIVGSIDALAVLRNTGLERSAALVEDIKWLTDEYDVSLKMNPPGEPAQQYCAFLRQFEDRAEMNNAEGLLLPKFICHFYNHYFAHTAGGRMIGKRMADMLLEGKTLRFYQWEQLPGNEGSGEVDVKQLLREVEGKIDLIAQSWSADQKLACCEETAACFRFGGSLLSYMRPPKK